MNNIKGLTKEEVKKSRNIHGKNILTSKNKNSFFKLVIESLNDPIIKILIMALAIKIIFLFKDSNIYETLGIVIAIFLAALVSAISEYGSEKAFERLNKENSNINVKVLRNKKRETIDLEEVVVGDIVYLESGDKVPADGIVISGELYVDESQLTGETIEKHKNVTNKNVYMGSVVTEKNGVIQITSVGDKTYYGKVASDIQEKTIESPLKTRLRHLASTISKLGYISALIILISYLFNALIIKNGYNLNEILQFNDFFPHLIYGLTLSVAVIVMAVPEGLPMMITLVLSSNMKRMLKRKVLVRKLVGIETAGSINILYSDKTGTLTEGKLKVISLMDTKQREYNKIDKLKYDQEYFEQIYQSLVYNNNSYYSSKEAEGGNTTDRAILNFIQSDKKDKYQILKTEVFDSKKKYSAVTTNYKINTTFIKGAFEQILNKCTYIYDNGMEKILTDKDKYLENLKIKMSDGYRILAMAKYTSDINKSTLLGFILLKDEIRKEAYEGIKTIKGAGIKVVMITGDAKETAVSVAKKLKIIESDNDVVLTSDELKKLSDENVKKIIPNLKVVARSLPEDKNRLVKLSQELHLTVGMTGDGVNDAPALKKADVGFSMGSGTEVAKEVSDIIILDDNINSISTAILYGRTIFKSIRKFVIFQLSVNLCAVLLSIIGPFIGILSPVTVVQMLWINMVMDTFAGLAFSCEPALKEYMKEPPKKRDEPIINRYMINQILIAGIYSTIICIWFLKSPIIKSIFRLDPSNKYLLTAFFGLFIFLAIFNAFNARTYRLNIFANLLKNKIFLIVISFIIIMQIILMYYGGEVFRTTGLTIYEFEIMLIISLTIIPVDFIRKYILKKRGHHRGV